MTRKPISPAWPLFGIALCFFVHLLTQGTISSLAFLACCLWTLATTLTALACAWRRQWGKALLMALPGLFLLLALNDSTGLREQIRDWGVRARVSVDGHRGIAPHASVDHTSGMTDPDFTASAISEVARASRVD